MRAALLAVGLLGCGRVGFDVPGGDGSIIDPTGDGGVPGGDGSMGTGAPTFVGANGSNGAANPTTTLPGVKAGDLVIIAIAYSGAMATITPMEADGDLVNLAVAQTGANQLHIALYDVRIGADHATETFGAVLTPMASEASIAVAQYRGPSGVTGESSGEFAGSASAKLFVPPFSSGYMVGALGAGAKVTAVSAGFLGRASIPGSKIATLDIGDMPIGSAQSVTFTLAGATDWVDCATSIP